MSERNRYLVTVSRGPFIVWADNTAEAEQYALEEEHLHAPSMIECVPAKPADPVEEALRRG